MLSKAHWIRCKKCKEVGAGALCFVREELLSGEEKKLCFDCLQKKKQKEYRQLVEVGRQLKLI